MNIPDHIRFDVPEEFKESILKAYLENDTKKLGELGEKILALQVEQFDRHFPNLSKHISNKTIWVENGCYVGLASDDTVVALGQLGDEISTELYLREHNTPDQW